MSYANHAKVFQHVFGGGGGGGGGGGKKLRKLKYKLGIS